MHGPLPPREIVASRLSAHRSKARTHYRVFEPGRYTLVWATEQGPDIEQIVTIHPGRTTEVTVPLALR